MRDQKASDDGASPAVAPDEKLRVLIDDMEVEMGLLRAAVEKGEQKRAIISMGLAPKFIEFARFTAE
jgi:hypothetical protein